MMGPREDDDDADTAMWRREQQALREVSAEVAAALKVLEALRWDWGPAYEITMTVGGLRAERRDGLGGPIDAAGPEELRRAMWHDYAVKPVPHD